MTRQRTKLAAAILALSAPAFALETTVGIRAESTHTDNVTRAQDNEISEITYQPGVNIAVEHQGPSIQANARYDYERRIRTEEVFDDDSALTGTSTVVWQAIPGRLDFTVNNTRTETTVNGQQGDLPNNVQVTDSTRAGPTLRFRVRRNDELQLQYFYTQTHADIANTNSTRHIGSVGYVMNVGQNDQVVFNVANNQVDFDNAGSPDLDALTSSVQWRRFGPNIDFSLLGGYTSMDRTLGRKTIQNGVYDARLTWRMTPQTSLTVAAVKELRDRPAVLELGILPFGTNNQIDSDLNEVFLNDRAEIELRTVVFSNEFTLSLMYDKQDYIDLLEDLERTTAAIGWRRRLSPKLTAAIQTSYRQEKLLDVNAPTEDRFGAEVSLGYNYNRRLSLLFTGSHNSVDTPITIQAYDENLYSLRVNYLLLE